MNCGDHLPLDSHDDNGREWVPMLYQTSAGGAKKVARRLLSQYLQSQGRDKSKADAEARRRVDVKRCSGCGHYCTQRIDR